jgi:hypothetical protein
MQAHRSSLPPSSESSAADGNRRPRPRSPLRGSVSLHLGSFKEERRPHLSPLLQFRLPARNRSKQAQQLSAQSPLSRRRGKTSYRRPAATFDPRVSSLCRKEVSEALVLLNFLIIRSIRILEARRAPSASSLISPSPFTPRLHFLRGEPPHDLLSLPMPLILRIVAAMAFSECASELSPPPAMVNPAQDVLRSRNVPYRVHLCPHFIPVISNPKMVHRSACLANTGELSTAAIAAPPSPPPTPAARTHLPSSI